MNNQTRTQPQTPAPATRPRVGRLLRRGTASLAVVVRRLAAAALVSVLAATGMIAMAHPAAAATSVSYCFRDVYGAPFALRDTSVEVWTGYSWLIVAYDRTGTNGCSAINTYPWRNYYLRLRAGTFTQNFVGTTPLHANPGYYSRVYLGTGYVYLRR